MIGMSGCGLPLARPLLQHWLTPWPTHLCFQHTDHPDPQTNSSCEFLDYCCLLLQLRAHSNKHVSLIPDALCLSFSMSSLLYSFFFFFKEKQNNKPKPSIILIGSRLSLRLGSLILCFLLLISRHRCERVVEKGTCSWRTFLPPRRAMQWFPSSALPRVSQHFWFSVMGRAWAPSLAWMLLLLAEIPTWRNIVSKWQAFYIFMCNSVFTWMLSSPCCSYNGSTIT